jgi:hypothetical protein
MGHRVCIRSLLLLLLLRNFLKRSPVSQAWPTVQQIDCSFPSITNWMGLKEVSSHIISH